jgi:putative ABC transport system permease protein
VRGLRMAREGLRFLGRNPRRTLLMLLGPLVGVAALTAVIASARGTSELVRRRMQAFGDRAMMVVAGDIGRDTHGGGGEHAKTLKLEDAEAVRTEVPGVVQTAPMVRERDFEVSFEGTSITTTVMGVTSGFHEAWSWPLALGATIEDDDVRALRPVCVLGETVRRKLFGDADPLGQSIRIGTKKFEVRGVLSKRGISPRGGDMDDRLHVPITTALRRLFNRDYIGMFRVLVEKPEQLGPVQLAVNDLLRRRHRIVPPETDDFEVFTASHVADEVRQSSGTMTTLLLVLAGIALLAGGVVVMNVMVVSVRERRREIGLRRALGATRGDVRTQFLLEAAAVTVLGGVLGAGLGTGAALLMQRLWKVPVLLTWEPYALALACSLAVGLLFGAYPARRAAQLPPVDALRG